MKTKMLQLLMLLLTISLFGSSKENSAGAKRTCVNENNFAESAGGNASEKSGGEADRPLLPRNFLFFY
jgi:hypothetical protein